MTLWRIYYTDGSTFSSDDGSPVEAPALAIVCIRQVSTDPHRHVELLRLFDWYWWREDERTWFGGDVHGLLDQAMNLGAMWPKQGRTMQNADYEMICSRAVRDDVGGERP